MRRTTTRLVAAGLACGLLLGGCGGSASTQQRTENVSDESRVVPAATARAATGQPQEATQVEHQIARKAEITVKVPDVAQAAGRLRTIADAHRGTITEEHLRTGGSTSSTVTLSVPADQLDAALNETAGLGEVINRTVSSEDVTTQVADLDARIRTMRESIARMQALMQRAGTVAEIAHVESELTKRQAELEALLAKQKVLSQRVAQSPVSVRLVTDEKAVTVEPPRTGFLAGLRIGWTALGSLLTGLLTVVGALIPLLAPVAVVVAPLVWWLRRRRAQRQAERFSQPLFRPEPQQPSTAHTGAAAAADQAPAQGQPQDGPGPARPGAPLVPERPSGPDDSGRPSPGPA